jgi:hypothetical protein
VEFDSGQELSDKAAWNSWGSFGDSNDFPNLAWIWELTDISGRYIVLQGKLDVISNPNVGYFKKSKKIGLFLETLIQ